MTQPTKPEALTVLYDGACPLCRREIAHVQGLAAQRPDGALCFVDVSAAHSPVPPQERAKLLARFHVQRADGLRPQARTSPANPIRNIAANVATPRGNRGRLTY